MAKKLTSGEGWELLPAEGSGKAESASLPPERQRLKLRLEQRRGKTVTVIFGLALAEADAKELAVKLKQACGTGGTFKGGEIELQGDRRNAARAWLHAGGWGLA